MGRQLTLDEARKPTGVVDGGRARGGRRGRTTVAHERRPMIAASAPVHVTLRLAPGVPSIRRERCAKVVRAAIAATATRTLRVVHFVILGIICI